MDPLSITASLIALSQATATSSKLLLDVIQSSKNRDDLIVLLNQLRHLVRLTTEILKRTETLELESNPSSLLNILLPTVDKLGEITYELTSVLSDVNPQEKRKFRGRGVVPLSDKRIVDISSRIERLIPSLTLAMTVNDMSSLPKLSSQMSYLQFGLDKVAQSVKESRPGLDLEKLLATSNPLDYHKQVRNKRQPGTGDWFLLSDEYEQWLASSHSVLWLCGGPGSGKTVLCSTVIDDSIKQAAYDQWSVDSNLGWHIMYFYFDAKDHNKTSLKNLVCSLLLQFSERSSTDREEILEWLHWGANQRQPGVEDLVSQLLLMLKDRGHTALILDALDECDDQKSLMRLLQAVYRTSSEVKVFLTSRREDVIEQGLGVLGATLRVDIAKHAVLEDIAQHIRERMKNDPNLARLSEASKKLIEERLITSANVTFRWVICQLDELRYLSNNHEVAQALDTLPKTLSETYARIMHQTPVARKIMQWIVLAARPLQLKEVAAVIAFMGEGAETLESKRKLADPRSILRICRSLVSVVPSTMVDDNGNQVRIEVLGLAHQSVKDFLVPKEVLPSTISEYHVTTSANREIAETCLVYILTITSADIIDDDFEDTFPLQQYASRYWMDHTLRVPSEEEASKLDILIDQLLEGPHLKMWIWMYDPDTPWRQSKNTQKSKSHLCTPLYYASRLGLLHTVNRLLESPKGAQAINTVCDGLGTPLQAAAYQGHESIVLALLEKGASREIRCGHFGTALQAAKFGRHAKIVEILQDPVSPSDLTSQDLVELKDHIDFKPDEKVPFEWVSFIGHGTSGSVDKIRLRADGRFCVRKTIEIPNEKHKALFRDEVKIMLKLHHKHIVDVVGSWTHGGYSSIIMSPVADRNLSRYLDECNNTQHRSAETADVLIRWLGCLAEGLRYIHSQEIKHKDVKPQNILIHGDNVLFTDFGLSHDFTGSQSMTIGETSRTIQYSAPEVNNAEGKNRSADIFSLGCVFAEMITVLCQRTVDDFKTTFVTEKNSTFHGSNHGKVLVWLDELSVSLQKSNRPYFQKQKLGEILRDIVKNMLALDPRNRPAAGILARTIVGSLLDGTDLKVPVKCCSL